MQQLEFLLEPGSMTTLARFCQTLHWLPTKHRIDFKILLMTYKALNGLAPQYLSELLSHYSPHGSCVLKTLAVLIIPRISNQLRAADRFSFLAPKLWNNLPNTVRGGRHTLSV